MILCSSLSLPVSSQVFGMNVRDKRKDGFDLPSGCDCKYAVADKSPAAALVAKMRLLNKDGKHSGQFGSEPRFSRLRLSVLDILNNRKNHSASSLLCSDASGPSSALQNAYAW